jgi:methionine aminopeptidase
MLMDLTTHVAGLRADVTAAAAIGGPEVARAAELLAEALDGSLRLVLLDVLGDAADELTAALDGPVVEVRLRGREPELVVSSPAVHPEPAVPAVPADDEGTARLTLRLPETLKARAEQAAAAEGTSVNTWLVRAVARALEHSSTGAGRPGPRRITGFGRA